METNKKTKYKKLKLVQTMVSEKFHVWNMLGEAPCFVLRSLNLSTIIAIR